jgi:NADPH-dependent 2,4-dienoyl-CoA reductase/sulfur reductase-like enzyme
MTEPRVLVVGGGLAGVTAVDVLRDSGFPGPTPLVDADGEPPYDRPPLSKRALARGVPVPLRTAEEWARVDVDLRLGVTAQALDVDGHRLLTSTGALPYDRLLLATGGIARWPAGLDRLPGAGVLRTAADASALRARLVPGARLVVVGAGLIGSEVAATARSLGVDVTLVDPLAQPLAAAVGAEVSQRLLDRHAAEGVRLLTGRTVAALRGSAAVEAVELDDGTLLPADAVLVAVGGAAASAWLQGSGLRLAEPSPHAGVCCDRTLLAAPDVWVAGDLAVPDGLGRSEHWMAAVEQAEVAAANLLGAGQEWMSVSYFWTDQYDVKVQVVGTPPADVPHDLEEASDDGRRQLRVWTDDGGRPVAVVTVNWPARAMAWRERVRTGAPVDETAPACAADGQDAHDRH